MRTLGAYEIDHADPCWEAVDDAEGYLATFATLAEIVAAYPDDRILVFGFASFEAAQGRAPEPDRIIEPRRGSNNVKTTEDLFSLKLWKSHQSHSLTTLYNALEGEALAITPAGRRLRARVKRDSYDAQSFAVVDCWTEEQGWVVVTRTLISEAHVFEFSFYGRDDTLWREAIGLDLVKLLTEAEAFLG